MTRNESLKGIADNSFHGEHSFKEISEDAANLIVSEAYDYFDSEYLKLTDEIANHRKQAAYWKLSFNKLNELKRK